MEFQNLYEFDVGNVSDPDPYLMAFLDPDTY